MQRGWPSLARLLYRLVITITVVLMAPGCTGDSGHSGDFAGKIIDFGQDNFREFPTSWDIKILAPKDNSPFDASEDIVCDFSVDVEKESMLPLALSAYIRRANQLYSNSPRAAKVESSPPTFIFRTTLSAPKRGGKYQLSITAVDHWWHKNATGALPPKPKTIAFTSNPITILVRQK